MLRTKWVPVESLSAPECADPCRRAATRVVVEETGNDTYRVVYGHYAYLRAVQAGVRRVSCLVRGETPDPVERLAEHVAVRCLTPVEEARLLREVMEAHDYTQRDMFREFGISQAHVSKRLALLRLDQDVCRRLDEGLLTIEQALGEARSVRTPQPGQ